MTTWTFRRATSADWPRIADLLTAADLPLDGAEAQLDRFLLAFRTETLVGAAALEQYDDVALLRSVVVTESEQGCGLGQELVQRVLQQAAAAGVEQVVLLTTTAAGFFPRFGFRTITRTEVPAAAHASVEFQSACPASAIVMLLDLSSPMSKL